MGVGKEENTEGERKTKKSEKKREGEGKREGIKLGSEETERERALPGCSLSFSCSSVSVSCCAQWLWPVFITVGPTLLHGCPQTYFLPVCSGLLAYPNLINLQYLTSRPAPSSPESVSACPELQPAGGLH